MNTIQCKVCAVGERSVVGCLELLFGSMFLWPENRRLLHQSILRGDEEASTFLISRGADVNLMTSLGHETPLLLAAAFASEGKDIFRFTYIY